jgi:hypothetical protein
LELVADIRGGGLTRMACLFEHNWGWPRKRGGRDVQICPDCGAERESRIRFDGPHYRRTQDRIRDFAASPLHAGEDTLADEAGGFSSLAA